VNFPCILVSRSTCYYHLERPYLALVAADEHILVVDDVSLHEGLLEGALSELQGPPLMVLESAPVH